MVTPETIEGVINDQLWFHYDVPGDVLYIRRADHRDAPTIGEETDEGDILLRHTDDDSPIGLTIINWWKRFGAGDLPDSIADLGRIVAPLGSRIAA